MNTYETTPERTLELLRQVVAERGEDYVYQEDERNGFGNPENAAACLYVRPDGSGPGCVAGAVFHAYGVPLEALATHEGSLAGVVSYRYGFDKGSGEILGEAQSVQDARGTWGEALEAAEGVSAWPEG